MVKVSDCDSEKTGSNPVIRQKIPMKKKKRVEVSGSFLLQKEKNTYIFKGALGKTTVSYDACDSIGNCFLKKQKEKTIFETGLMESYEGPYSVFGSKKTRGRFQSFYKKKDDISKNSPFQSTWKESISQNPWKRGDYIEKKRPVRKIGSLDILEQKINGCQYGYALFLKLVGLGYKFSLYPSQKKEDWTVLSIKAGHSHKIKFYIPKNLGIFLYPRNLMVLYGPEQEIVWNIGYQIRSVRPPTPYKGKGIRFLNEPILLREGKKNK